MQLSCQKWDVVFCDTRINHYTRVLFSVLAPGINQTLVEDVTVHVHKSNKRQVYRSLHTQPPWRCKIYSQAQVCINNFNGVSSIDPQWQTSL